jgi:hypothetical protein
VTIPADQTGAMNPGSVTRTWSPGFRLGPELGVELAPLPHGRLRLFGGLSYPLDEASCWVPAPDGASAQTMPCGGPQVPALARDSQDPQPYLGLAVGWSLSPAQGQHLPPAAWYGWQTMLLDVGAATLVALSGPGADSRRTPFRYAAEQQAPLVFVAGGPLVHLTHRRPLPAAASLVLRGGSLVAGWLIGSRWDASECIRFGCKSSYVITGAAVVASAVDAAWLAWEH